MMLLLRNSRLEVFFKIVVLKKFAKFTGKHMCLSLFPNKVGGWSFFIKKETPKQVFSSEFCKNFKNIYFVEHMKTAASVCSILEIRKFFGKLWTIAWIFKSYETMEPMFMAISYFRRRRFDDCIEVCSRMLQKNPYDQVRRFFTAPTKTNHEY